MSQDFKPSKAERRASPGKNKVLQGEISKFESILQAKRDEIEILKSEIETQNSLLKVLRNRRDRKLKQLDEIRELDEQLHAKSVFIKPSMIKRRLEQPTSEELAPYHKIARRKETFNVSLALHGGSFNNKRPAMIGLVDTLTAKYLLDALANELFKSKPKLARALTKKVPVRSIKEYEKSNANYFVAWMCSTRMMF